ncbi:hypothetical protein J2Z72_000300 [Peptostreptococcus canis]|nr:hypothetical protein [Peptostreptococcus canis]
MIKLTLELLYSVALFKNHNDFYFADADIV